MDSTEITNAVKEAVKAQLQQNVSATDQQTNSMVQGVEQAVKPVLERLAKIEDDAKKQRAEATEKQAKEDATKAAEKLVNEVRESERERFSVMTQAAPLLNEQQRASLANSDVKEILVTALAEKVQNAKEQSVDFLRGLRVVAR